VITFGVVEIADLLSVADGLPWLAQRYYGDSA
jgi:hypothetical protein